MLFITKLLCLTVFWTVTALWTFFLVIPAKPGASIFLSDTFRLLIYVILYYCVHVALQT